MDLKPFSSTVVFPELPPLFRQREARVMAESLTSATTKAVHMAFQDVTIRTRKPRILIVTIRTIDHHEY